MSTNDSPNPSDATPVADPLSLFLSKHRAGLPARRGTKRFNAGEHAWLGSEGAQRACEWLEKQHTIEVDPKVFESILRQDGREVLQYGELVGLSGDFYESPDALFEERPSPLPWLWESNDLSDIRAVFEKELSWISSRLGAQPDDRPYPDENLRLAWNAKSYVELALRNVDHFGWHNLCAYVRYHGQALALAASCGGRNNETFRRALYTNAFADHFLTDGFAAGHIRVPRAEIRDWAEARGYGDKVAGALSKLLHDQDGHVDVHSLHGDADEEHDRSRGDGLHVLNARGEDWHTYCDGQLFLEHSAASPAVEQAVRAVSESVGELLLAWQRRDLPPGVYAATRTVPFPHPDAPTLTEKFSPAISEADFEALWKSVAWYSRVKWIAGLERQHVKELFASLPALMANFRASVAARATDPELAARIDPAYVQAYCRLA